MTKTEGNNIHKGPIALVFGVTIYNISHHYVMGGGALHTLSLLQKHKNRHYDGREMA